jgi:hypothetical protein
MIKFKNKNLIISCVGDNSLHKNWINKKSYDLFLINYGSKNYSKDCKFYKEKKGFKYNLIYEEITKNNIFEKYDYVWIPDDDIYMSTNEIELLFEIAQKYDLWICQPSIIGWYGLKITLNNIDTKIRFTNYVEIMCPCFNSYALKKCLETFQENKSGWGIDHLWNIKLGQPTDKIAIIDEVTAIHTRPVGGGEIYKKLNDKFSDSQKENCDFSKKSNGKFSEAQEENYDLWKKFNLDKSSFEDLKRGKLVSVESFGLSYHNLVEYSRVYRQPEAGCDLTDRFYPPANYLKESIKKLND